MFLGKKEQKDVKNTLSPFPPIFVILFIYLLSVRQLGMKYENLDLLCRLMWFIGPVYMCVVFYLG